MNYKNEEWVDILGMTGLYQISNYGRVKSLPKMVITNTEKLNRICFRKEKILSWCYDRAGYARVKMKKYNNGKTMSIHRLVALHFLPNPNCKKEVNHKDGNKLNNHYSNLEWCTRSENLYHAYSTGLRMPSQAGKSGKLHHNSKPVLQIINDDKKIKWDSMNEAAVKLNLSRGNIWAACNGKIPTCGGFKWEYSNN